MLAGGAIVSAGREERAARGRHVYLERQSMHRLDSEESKPPNWVNGKRDRHVD